MKTALFITFPYPSHYYPAFAFAKEWQSKGYKIIFTGNSENLQQIVSDEGFEFQYFLNSIEYSVHNFKIFFGLLIKSIFDKNFIKNRYKEFYNLKIQAKSILESAQPDVIFIDEHLSYCFPFFNEKNREIVVLNPMLSATKRKGIPPLNSSMLATNTPFNRLKCEVLWHIHLTNLRFKELKQQIVFLGKDDLFFLKRLLKKDGLSYNDVINTNHSFYRGIKNIKTILIAPQELEYDFVNKSPNETYNLAPIIRNETAYMTPEYNELIKYIHRKKELSNIKVICCSFGTLTELNQKRVERFVYQVLSKINEPNILIIISSKFIEENRIYNTNIKVLPFLPHLDFLNRVDIMITHGGLGTIKECLQFKKKMIVYPILKNIDQPGNAIRVQNKGFGLMGDLDKETVVGLRGKINMLLLKS